MASDAPPATLENFQKPIVLVGMMGTGKSVIGRKLARALGREFRDSDQQIEREAGRTIPDIFDREGEVAFRDLEKRTIAGLLQTPRCVIALGGGAVIDPVTRARLAREAIGIWLQSPVEEIVARVARKRDRRPLLRHGDLRETVESLLAARAPFYAQAPIHIDSAGQTESAVVAMIIKALCAYAKDDSL